MDKFRLFIGLPPAPAVGERLAAVMERMAEQLPFKRWTHPADLHVTLHFLGDTPRERVDAIRKAMADAAAESGQLGLALTGPGTFGPPDAPRVLWCGVADTAAGGSLAALHAALAPKLAAAGCSLEDRPFRAHVTLARQGGAGCRREDAEAAWQAALSSAGIPNSQVNDSPATPFAWTADHVTLFHSHLGRRPSYERIHEVPLTGAQQSPSL